MSDPTEPKPATLPKELDPAERERIYAELGKLAEQLGMPCVIVALDERDEGHTHVLANGPGTDTLTGMQHLAKRALFGLAMQAQVIDEAVAREAIQASKAAAAPLN